MTQPSGDQYRAPIDPETYYGQIQAEIATHHEELASITAGHNERALNLVHDHAAALSDCEPIESLPGVLRAEVESFRANFSYTASSVEQQIDIAARRLEGMLSPDDAALLAEARRKMESSSFGLNSVFVGSFLSEIENPITQQAIRTIMDSDALEHIRAGVGTQRLDETIIGENANYLSDAGFDVDGPTVTGELRDLPSHPVVSSAISASLDIVRMAKIHHDARFYGTNSISARGDIMDLKPWAIQSAVSASLDSVRLAELLKYTYSLGDIGPAVDGSMKNIPSDVARSAFSIFTTELAAAESADIAAILRQLGEMPRNSREARTPVLSERAVSRIFRGGIAAVAAAALLAAGLIVWARSSGESSQPPAASEQPFQKPTPLASPTSSANQTVVPRNSASPKPTHNGSNGDKKKKDTRLSKAEMDPPLSPTGGEWDTAAEAALDASNNGNYARDNRVVDAISDPRIWALATQAVQYAEAAELAYVAENGTDGLPEP